VRPAAVTTPRAIPVATRLARPSDAATLSRTVALGAATYVGFAPPGWSPLPPPDDVETLTARLARRDTWALLAEIRGEPAGHVALFPDWRPGGGVYLFQLFVRPAWWGTGLASGLHDAFVAEARARGYRHARLHTPAAHARARRFYERRGWRADTLLEEDRGLPLAVYGRPLLP
jgi:GNAT superfamily N-acetyltransferase